MHKGVLLAGLAAVVALAVYEPKSDDSARASLAHAEPRLAADAPATDPLHVPQRQTLSAPRGELFGAPPAIARASQPPPAPTSPPAAPPLPYRFAGIVRQGGESQVLVAKGEKVFPVQEGETLDGAYRVRSVSAQRIELEYLPLGVIERIAVNSTLDAKPVAQAPRHAATSPAAAKRTADPPLVDTASLRWEGPGEIRAGSSVSVALHLSYDGPLRAAPIQLRFEPGALEALSVRPGKFLNRGQFSYRISPEGSIFVGASAAGASPGKDAELLVVTFRPTKAGTMAGLSMAALDLQGIGGGPVSHAQLPAYRAAIVP